MQLRSTNCPPSGRPLSPLPCVTDRTIAVRHEPRVVPSHVLEDVVIPPHAPASRPPWERVMCVRPRVLFPLVRYPHLDIGTGFDT